MTKQDLEKIITWDENGIGRCKIFVPFLQKEIEFEVFSGIYENPKISDFMLQTIEDVLALSENSIEIIKNLLWEDCNFSFAITDYGNQPQKGETYKQVNFKEFQIHSKQDAFDKSILKTIQIPEKNNDYKTRYAQIMIDSASNNYICIIIKKGKIIDYDDDGTYLGWFETDEKYAHREREKVLKNVNQ